MTDQTAMLLTQQEWDDLTAIAEHYRYATAWLEYPDTILRRKENPEHIEMLKRHRALCTRIIEANQ